MALISNYESNEIVYPSAYMCIRKITLGNSDEEYFEFDPETSFENLKYRKIYEAIAYVYIYSDVVARNNNVIPIDVLSIPFDHNPYSEVNIYKQAYDAFKTSEKLKELIYKDA